jgi:protein required for attachment to host cells
MQIPQTLHPFPKPTLVVVTDNVRAKLYLATDRSVNLVHTISTKLEPMEQERVAIRTGSGDMRSGEQHEHNEEWAREQLYGELSTDLMHRLQNGAFEDLALCAPEENMNELKESLHMDLLKRASVFVEKHLTGEDPIDIVAYVQEA